MNPAKRKKLLRFKLHQEETSKKNSDKTIETKIEQVVLLKKEEVKEEEKVIQEQQDTVEISNVELALKSVETTETTETTESKKEKKKKWSSQDA